MKPRLALVMAMGCCVLAASCSSGGGDDPAPGNALSDLVLTTSDVPSATGDRSVDELDRTTGCTPLAQAQNAIVDAAGSQVSLRSFDVSGATFETGVLDVQQAGASTLVKDVADAVRDCSDDDPVSTVSDSLTLTSTVAELPGLPAGAAGYVETTKGSDGSTRVDRRAFAATGTRIVVVGLRRDDATATSLDLPALLATAVGKAQAGGTPS